jgi:hypothetical protein
MALAAGLSNIEQFDPEFEFFSSLLEQISAASAGQVLT